MRQLSARLLFALAAASALAASARAQEAIRVDATILHQQIDGFGAGAAYLYEGQNPLAQEYMDFLYGTDPGEIGLTLIRVRIRQEAEGVWDWEIANGQKAHALGAKILASPWTPPERMKSNNNRIGGYLLASQYSNYVDYLNAFLALMAANDAPVSVISLQNEPDFVPIDYEGCGWSAEQLRVFCRDFAGEIDAPVMMPEAFGFNPNVSNATLNDPLAAANVDYVGGHLYGASVRDYPLAHSLGKRAWMTEFLINDQSIQTATQTARQISQCLTVGNMSAYIWWKLIGDANGLLNNAGQPQRRAYVMAQFSRFARPGSIRIGTSGGGALAISAFIDPDTRAFAIVAVNDSAQAVARRFELAGLVPYSVSPWITTATRSLEPLQPLPVLQGSFSFDIPAYSVVTFAGTDGPQQSFLEYLALHDLPEPERGFADDPDRDGMATGFEYLIGAEPARADFRGIEWTRSASVDTIALAVPPYVGEGLLKIQISPDLVEWETEATYDFSTRAAEGLTFRLLEAGAEIEFSRAAPEDSETRFYRVAFALGGD